MEYGRVKSFSKGKRFGFVTVLDANNRRTEEKLFFHLDNRRQITDNDPQRVIHFRTGWDKPAQEHAEHASDSPGEMS